MYWMSSRIHGICSEAERYINMLMLLNARSSNVLEMIIIVQHGLYRRVSTGLRGSKSFMLILLGRLLFASY